MLNGTPWMSRMMVWREIRSIGTPALLVVVVVLLLLAMLLLLALLPLLLLL